jgi:hypothetical protein
LNVTVFTDGSPPRELLCRYLQTAIAIAVDNEGDVFVNQNGAFVGVVEINGPNRPDPNRCTKLDLKPETGYAAGLALDPKTDDLIVLDNPGPERCRLHIAAAATPIAPQPRYGSTTYHIRSSKPGSLVSQILCAPVRRSRRRDSWERRGDRALRSRAPRLTLEWTASPS